MAQIGPVKVPVELEATDTSKAFIKSVVAEALLNDLRKGDESDIREFIRSMSNDAWKEQLQLIARILDRLCAINAIEPHFENGVNVGRCRDCGAIGQLVYIYQRIKHEHNDECVLALNAQLQALVKGDDNGRQTQQRGSSQ